VRTGRHGLPFGEPSGRPAHCSAHPTPPVTADLASDCRSDQRSGARPHARVQLRRALSHRGAADPRERGLPFELGRCLLALGTAQRKARQRRDAAATLEEAAAVFAALGAPQWQALAQAQRARLAPRPGTTLTPTEQRIADLVAAGQTNPEIAATLYVSVKTVEANLTRIYRKLGLRSRVELARSHPS